MSNFEKLGRHFYNVIRGKGPKEGIKEGKEAKELKESQEDPQKKRVVVALGARMVHPEGKEDWKFPLFVENQTNVGTALPGEVSGGWSRMRGVQSEFQREKAKGGDMMVFTTGGKEPTGESRAEGGARELVERYGLPKESVLALTGAGSTLGNARGAAEYIRDHKDQLGTVREIEVATNDYHSLRAWIMFSIAMLQVTTDKAFAVTDEDKQRVKELLDRGIAAEWNEYPSKMKETRAEVMQILSPYFKESKIGVKPLVIEEALEADNEPAKAKYAEKLRDDKMVRATLVYEYGGIKDLLDGKYKVK